MKTENGKTTYSAPCGMKGCIDYNKKISEAIAEYNQQEGTGFDAMSPRDVACFFLGDGIMGKVTRIGCGCEIRGGGNLICPLHIHFCELHSGVPKGWESVQGGAALADQPEPKRLPCWKTCPQCRGTGFTRYQDKEGRCGVCHGELTVPDTYLVAEEPKPLTIDLTPKGCETMEGCERVRKAMTDFENATAVVANEAETFLDSYGTEIAGMVRGNNPELIENINELNAAMENRRRKQEAFLRAIAGVPATPKETRSQASDAYWDGLHAIQRQFTEVGYKATLEGGGAALPFFEVTLKDGRVVHYGDLNEVWGVAIYANAEAASDGGEIEGRDTELDSKVTDPAKVVDAFKAIIGE